MNTTCTICPRTAPEDTYACPACLDDIRGWLTELPRQAKLLAEFLVPGTGAARGRIGGTGRATAPLPVDLRVLVLLAPGHPVPVGAPEDNHDSTVPIRAFLTGWADHFASTYPAVLHHPDDHHAPRPKPSDHTLTGWCHWLTACLPYVASHPPTTDVHMITDLHHQLRALVHRIRDLTHTVPHTHPLTAPCPHCQAFGLVTTDGHHLIRCTLCDHTLTPDTYDTHVAALLDDHHRRTPVTVLRLVGDDAEIVTDPPPGHPAATRRHPAIDIAADLGIPTTELPGLHLTAAVHDDQLTAWRTA
ncbi:hypothetical protein [Streptomyces acidiscabies]|uniref:Uncharacterized protein n=1 Tax=Streptomyces acidiscabies TaxID=42234 RepID=A0ABU4MBI5_9ACTN|nr:hypothetical protein [Streptomyces acidiscabies]MDX3024053.1 hypothetical protein [Streptomyces acidiscabies]